MFKHFALATTLAVLAGSSYAAETMLPYAGLDVGSTKLDGVSGHHTSVGGFVGFEFDPQAAVEVGYRRLASVNILGADVDAKQTHVSILGLRPLMDNLQIFGRLGVSHLTGTAHYQGASASDSTNKVLYGGGLDYAFTPAVHGRVELQRSGSDATNASFAVAFRF
jgi:OOP family OmpA-OmpF porin